MDEDHEPARAPVVRRVLAGSAPPPMDEECDREPPVVPPERKTAVAQSAAPKGTANVPPPDLPVRQPRVQQQSAPTPEDARKVPQAKDARKVPRAKGAREVPQAKGAREVPQATDAGEVPQAKGVREVPQAKYAGKVPQAKDQGNVPPAVPVRPDPVPSSAARAPRNSEGGNAPRNGHGPAADGARQSEPAQPPPPGYAEVTGDKKGRFSMDGGIAGMVRGVVGKKSSEGKDSDEDEVSELEKKRCVFERAMWMGGFFFCVCVFGCVSFACCVLLDQKRSRTDHRTLKRYDADDADVVCCDHVPLEPYDSLLRQKEVHQYAYWAMRILCGRVCVGPWSQKICVSLGQERGTCHRAKRGTVLVRVCKAMQMIEGRCFSSLNRYVSTCKTYHMHALP